MCWTNLTTGFKTAVSATTNSIAMHRHGQKLSKITSSKEEQALLDIFRQLAAADRHVLKRQVQMLLAVAEQEKKAAASAAREAG